MRHHTHILMFSLGPVQSFIAEARRTVDLSNGSYMLVEVARSAARAVDLAGGQLIFPTTRALEEEVGVPNVLVALVANPKGVAEKAVEAAKKQWGDFAEDALNKMRSKDDPLLQEIWRRQRVNHLEFYWAAVPYSDNDYAACSKKASETLAARKRTRTFEQVHEDGPKDSLSGSRSALRTSQPQNRMKSAIDYWQKMRREKTASELLKWERLDTIGAMKRFLERGQRFPSTSTIAVTSFIKQAAKNHRALVDELRKNIETINQSLKNLPPDMEFANEDTLQTIRRIAHDKQNYLRSIRNFADPAFPYGGDLLFVEGWARERLVENYDPLPRTWYEQIKKQLEAARSTLRTLHQKSDTALSPYYAILQMDGDLMGKHVSQCKQLKEHQKLSEQLTEFTQKARGIVNSKNGYLIYAGGDDVLAFFPADTVLEAAGELAGAYRRLFPSSEWSHQNEGRPFPFTASTGIAFAHYIQPLDLVLEAARAAEKRAKNKYGRNAICVTVLRRSGERLDVGGKWAGEPEQGNAPAPNTVEMATELIKHLQAGEIASRFAYNVLRDAPTITAIEQREARKLILQQLLKQHKAKSLSGENAEVLIESWFTWANRHDGWVPPNPAPPPGEESPKNQGFVELARWFVLARWLAEGGRE